MQVKSLPSAIVWLQMYSCGIAEDKDGPYIITGGYNLNFVPTFDLPLLYRVDC